MALDPAGWGDQLLDAIDQAIIVTDLTGRILYWGRYAEQLYGWTAGEMLGQTASVLIPPELLEQGQEIVAQLRRGERWAGEFLVRRRDGSTFPALVTDSPLRDSQGNLVGIVGVSTDLTLLRTSESQWQAMYDASPIPTYRWQRAGADFVLVDCNRAGLAATDGRVARLVGQTAGALYADRPDIREDLARCWSERTVVQREMTYSSRTTGEIRDVRLTYAFVPPDRILVHSEDETERSRAAAALRESEARFRALVEHGYDTITLIAADGTIQYSSPSMERLTGYTAAERRHQSLEDLIHVDDREQVRERWRQVCCEPGGSEHAEMRVRHKNGSWRLVESIATNHLEDPEIRGVVVNTRDVTERREAEVALQAAERRVLAAQVEAIRLTARELADRLNNDLTGIAGVLRLVEMQDALPEDICELLPDAVASLDRACQVVTHLYEVTRIATHDTPLGPALDLERSTAPPEP